jgi:hypothetical protein
VVNRRPIVWVVINVELPNRSLPHNAQRLVTCRLNSHKPDLYRFSFMAQLKQNEFATVVISESDRLVIGKNLFGLRHTGDNRLRISDTFGSAKEQLQLTVTKFSPFNDDIARDANCRFSLDSDGLIAPSVVVRVIATAKGYGESRVDL